MCLKLLVGSKAAHSILSLLLFFTEKKRWPPSMTTGFEDTEASIQTESPSINSEISLEHKWSSVA